MSSPEITRVSQGRLAGVLSGDGKIVAYKGIPYAAPPVGERRWRAPLEAAGWEGIRSARSFGASAPQFPVAANSLYVGGHEHQSEDCLTLNVWTAAGAGPGDAHRPVLVWFHLGAFQYGSGSVPLYDGAALARAGAVVVTVNFRLGRLGFLAHPWLSAESATGTSGNYGLLDQIAALRWIGENAAAFGGDRDLITAVGLSAGSSSVSLLLASPLARGAFTRAIAMSGAQLGPVGASSGLAEAMQDLEHAERSGAAVASTLGAASLESLRRVSPADLMAVPPASGQGPKWRIGQGMRIGRGVFDSSYPIVDGHVVPGSPLQLYLDGRFERLPLMTGSSANEAAGLPYLESLEAYREELDLVFGDRARDVLAHYPAADDTEAVIASGALNADRIFVWQNWTLARLHGRACGNGTTFYYHSARVPPLPGDHQYAERNPGAFHGLEIPYVFRNLSARAWPWEPVDHELSRVMAEQWLQFARSGSPNGPDLPRWEPFDERAPEAMTFSAAGARLEPVRRLRQLALWDPPELDRHRSALPLGASTAAIRRSNAQHQRQ